MSTSLVTPSSGPRRNVMVGLTHSKEYLPIISESKAIKVGIGLPRGKAVDVFVSPDGKWNIRVGELVGESLKFKTLPPIETRAEAEAIWRREYDKAPLCNYPRKVAYFVFTKPVMSKEGTEVYIPDFDAIEANSFTDGNVGAPTWIDIVFLNNSPYSAQYAMWSASELRCAGDGIDAERSVLMYKKEEDVPEPLRDAWKLAKKAGQRNFPILGGCWACECPFSKENGDKPSPCKPSADLRFQLLRSARVGGTAFLHTSGFKSIKQLFSGIESIKELTGSIYGVPVRLVLRSHVTNHKGQKAIQQNFSLQPRPEDKATWNKLIEKAWKIRANSQLTGVEGAKLIEAAEEDTAQESPMSAQALKNEFYFDDEGDGGEEAKAEPTTNSPATAAASQQKVTDIGYALRKQTETKAAKESPKESPKEATPAAAPNGPVSTEEIPWKKRVEMLGAIMDMRMSLGDDVVTEVLANHGFAPGSAVPDIKEAAKVLPAYRKMEELKAAKESEEKAAPPQGDRPLF